MRYQRIGSHFNIYKSYEFRRHLPYDYKRNGIINKMISPIIYNTKNKTTKMLVDFIEAFAQFFTEYVGDLKNFKNFYYRKH